MVLLFLYAVGVAYSRMYLGQHFLTMLRRVLYWNGGNALVITLLERIKKAKHGEIKS
jgi:hypothetical protein